MYNFILGTIFSFICAILLGYSTFSKNKKEMAKIQIYNPIFGALSNFFLCSYSAVVINIVNSIRNYLMYKGKLSKIITLLCIIFYIVFGLLFNTKSWIGIFPILAATSYAIFCLKSRDSQSLRYGLILNQLLWGMHDIYIKAYPSLIIEAIIIIVSIHNILKFIRTKKKVKNDKNPKRKEEYFESIKFN